MDKRPEWAVVAAAADPVALLEENARLRVALEEHQKHGKEVSAVVSDLRPVEVGERFFGYVIRWDLRNFPSSMVFRYIAFNFSQARFEDVDRAGECGDEGIQICAPASFFAFKCVEECLEGRPVIEAIGKRFGVDFDAHTCTLVVVTS